MILIILFLHLQRFPQMDELTPHLNMLTLCHGMVKCHNLASYFLCHLSKKDVKTFAKYNRANNIM